MRLSLHELTVLGTVLRDAAAREVMPRFRRLPASGVRTKSGPLDLVTEADEAAERVITAGLQRAFPGCVVIGEEATAADPSLLERVGEAELAFVVDPVDGTANFAAGLPLFATMAAAIVRGEVVAAVIHDPVGDDSAFALRGEGAWIAAPDGRRQELRVATPAPVASMTGTTSWRFLPAELKATVCRNLPRIAASWDYRCAGHEYRLLASGQCHFLLFNRLMPWDHAPGWLLHQEAGGYSARFDGSPYRPALHGGGLICTPDAASWHALHTALLQP
ncbi:Inositol monophosphatase [Rhodovastum atsumiense]|uniref:Inositol monophosphatase n=1 Tax=Rhodovastum atsumiense TaxID=504468 RepID=A0A5M6IPG7_9PROT|nr:inositol monophosphatase family protein [Rhodovastum atsumiense]KAA5610173.1 inositol monophosphatase [Rhodovastum atsumiense]CAH2599266.1 Inositol monophosphatase [Rhodovastum atsumiense]